MPYFNHDDIDFYFEDDGGNGIPFVFLHGLGGDVNQPLGLIERHEKIRRISMDFRGHGKTHKFGNSEKFSFNIFAKDVIALLNYLNINKVIIGGISTGAGVALNIALNYEEVVDKLILSRVAWEDGPQATFIQEAFGKIHESLMNNSITNAKSKYMQEEIYKRMDKLSKYAGSSLVEQFNYPHINETSEKLVRLPSDAPNFSRHEWKNIKIPTLIIANKFDPIHPYEYGKLIASYIPNSRFFEVTSKTISNEKHTHESRKIITDFLLQK
jgi:pimeloyl-ACP methyl ester carboxylesterase